MDWLAGRTETGGPGEEGLGRLAEGAEAASTGLSTNAVAGSANGGPPRGHAEPSPGDAPISRIEALLTELVTEVKALRRAEEATAERLLRVERAIGNRGEPDASRLGEAL